MTYPGAIDSFGIKTDHVTEVLAAHVNDIQTALVNTQTELGTDPAGTATDVKTRLVRSLDGAGNLQFKAATDLTISGGVITVTQNYHRVDTESSAATDDLDTITATAEAMFLIIRPNNSARDVVIKHGTGNIKCAGDQDITLGTTNDFAILLYDDVLDLWLAFGMTAAALLAASNTFTGNTFLNGGFRKKYTAASGDVTLLASHNVVGVNASGAARVVTVPTAVGIAGTEYTIVKTDSSANTVTLTIDGNQTINGATTHVLSTQFAKVTIISNGTNWFEVT